MNEQKKLLIITVSLFLLISPQKAESQQRIFVKTSNIPQQPRPEGEFVPGEIIVKFKSGVGQNLIDSLNIGLGVQHLYTSPYAGFKRFKISEGRTVVQMVEIYKQNPLVEYAEPNFLAYASFVPNDEFYHYQWHLQNPTSGSIKMQDAWDIKKGDLNVIVAVVDTGVAFEDFTQTTLFGIRRYYQAPDLAQTNFVAGYDFYNNDSHPNDDEGHGTHVTGTIAQSTNNTIGVAGVAFGTSIMPVKVLGSNGSGSYANVSDGIRFAADRGAKVINLSLGGSSSSITLENACAYAYNKGVTLLCAAGNEGRSPVSFPAAYDQYCIAVGATRFDEKKASYSNYGNSLDVVAPGGDLNVDQNGDGYGDGILQQTFGNTTNAWGYFYYQGTSMATPHVSGLAALLLAQDNTLSSNKIREILQTTAKDLGPVGFDTQSGWGLVDAFSALTYNSIPNTPPVANPGGPYSANEDEAIQFNGSGSYDTNGDSLAYSWDFGDGATGSGVSPVHSYTRGGNYTVTLVVSDGKANSDPAATSANIIEVNDPPVADAGGPYSGYTGQAISFNGSGSYDSDGSITNYLWDLGDGTTSNEINPSHSYSAGGNYSVKLTVTDNGGLTAEDTSTATVTDQAAEIEVFSDSFEISEWNGLWSEDSQNDWFRSSQRAVNGGFSAEVDGIANDAKLMSIPIDLKGRTNATITYSWYIESSLDPGEYIAFDVSTDNGVSWTEMKRLSGNIDIEDQWHPVTIDLTNISNLKLRFRGKMSAYNEDADVDMVRVLAH